MFRVDMKRIVDAIADAWSISQLLCNNFNRAG